MDPIKFSGSHSGWLDQLADAQQANVDSAKSALDSAIKNNVTDPDYAFNVQLAMSNYTTCMTAQSNSIKSGSTVLMSIIRNWV